MSQTEEQTGTKSGGNGPEAPAVGATATSTNVTPAPVEDLPANRFELELEFVQALASPAYLHFLATSRSEDGTLSLLQDPNLTAFFIYLRDTWSRPEYSRFIQYPHALYFLDLLIEKPTVLKEWTLPAFRNFCHQQQFLAWQHRHSVCYGVGSIQTNKDSGGVNVQAAGGGGDAGGKENLLEETALNK
jgi:mediator of RNA polymerase II transcription subunit 31